MALTEAEKMKVQNLTHEEVYERIRTYYQDFIEHWNTLDDNGKAGYKLDNGREVTEDTVNRSIDYIKGLSPVATKTEATELARMVISADLEYAYQNIDIHWIKMGAYAHYLENLIGNRN